jgi:hypothetical protein
MPKLLLLERDLEFKNNLLEAEGRKVEAETLGNVIGNQYLYEQLDFDQQKAIKDKCIASLL